MHNSVETQPTRSKLGNSGPALIVQERDRRLFSELAHVRLATTQHCITIAEFGSYSRAKDRLRRLVKAGMLRRCFIGTISGGRKAVYSLSPKAAAILGITAPAVLHRQDQLIITADQYINHELHITELYLGFRYRRLPEGVSFIRWRRFSVPLAESIRLIPDGYCDLQTPQGIRCCFVEVDLGTEALRIWQQKVQSYLQLAVSGEFHKLSGQNQFRVLVVATSQRRLLSIRKAVAAATDKIFWFATIDDINQQGLFATVWLRPTGEQRHCLI